MPMNHKLLGAMSIIKCQLIFFKSCCSRLYGRGDRTRTGTLEWATDFKSVAATYYATPPCTGVLGTGRHPWIYLLPANQAGSAHDITEPTKELKVLLGFTYLLSFIFNNSQLLLFPACVCIWYCLVGHDSHLAFCCSVDMNYPTTGYLPATGIA